MIEVELKFKPTEEQLYTLLKRADFVGEKTLHDIYFDFEDYKLLKDGIKLRKRNNFFELKIRKNDKSDKEIVDENEIELYFNTNSLEGFVKDNLKPVIEYTNKRREYKIGKFTIDLDETDFGYKICELEVLVENETEVRKTQEEIIDFLKGFGISVSKMPTKRGEYLRIFKPNIYEELKKHNFHDKE